MTLSFDFVKEQIERTGTVLVSPTYVNGRSKLMVRCSKGHEYQVTYANFRAGKSCRVCQYINAGIKRRHSYDFVKTYVEKNDYQLDSPVYVDAHQKLKMRCPKGHKCQVSWNSFQQGHRCFICSGKKRLTCKQVAKRIYRANGHRLMSTEYVNNETKLKIQCDKGHIYERTYGNFCDNNRCPECNPPDYGRNKRQAYDFIKNQIEKKECCLLSSEYKNAHEKLRIRCPKGHEFEMSYNNFKQGQFCPKCSGSSDSKAEKEITNYIKSFGFTVLENSRSIIPPFELDIVVPEKKIALEVCGLYWHSELHKDKDYHLNKLKECNKIGYRLITIFEDEWLFKQETAKNRLQYIFGLEDRNLHDKKYQIKEIEVNQAKEFIDAYHIQEYIEASNVQLGAFDQDQLIAVMTFSNLSQRKNKHQSAYSFELNRFCAVQDIAGVASKLLNYFQKNYACDKIVTFADRRWSEGDLYQKIGFKKCYDELPSYFYFNDREHKRYHRFNFRKGVLNKKLKTFDINKTKHQNMLENGWLRIYDCGSIKYEMLGLIP